MSGERVDNLGVLPADDDRFFERCRAFGSPLPMRLLVAGALWCWVIGLALPFHWAVVVFGVLFGIAVVAAIGIGYSRMGWRGVVFWPPRFGWWVLFLPDPNVGLEFDAEGRMERRIFRWFVAAGIAVPFAILARVLISYLA